MMPTEYGGNAGSMNDLHSKYTSIHNNTYFLSFPLPLSLDLTNDAYNKFKQKDF